MKRCSACKKRKRFSSFHRSRKGRDGRASVCNACWPSVYARKKYDIDPYANTSPKRCSACHEEKPRTEFSPRFACPDGLSGQCRRCVYLAKLRRQYGLSQEAFEALNPRECGICKTLLTPDGPRATLPQVDHDHRTGRVRGILCAGCNVGIAMFDRDPRLLRQVAAYLEIDQ